MKSVVHFGKVVTSGKFVFVDSVLGGGLSVKLFDFWYACLLLSFVESAHKATANEKASACHDYWAYYDDNESPRRKQTLLSIAHVCWRPWTCRSKKKVGFASSSEIIPSIPDLKFISVIEELRNEGKVGALIVIRMLCKPISYGNFHVCHACYPNLPVAVRTWIGDFVHANISLVQSWG